jgi:hypothetical protein
MKNKKQPVQFDKTICGFNLNADGIKSFSKSIQLGPFQVTLNANQSGVRGSISLPGTGLSRRDIKLF